MKDEFLSLASQVTSKKDYENKAMQFIIKDLMLSKLRGKDKLKHSELGEGYEMESKLQAPIIPGHVFIFIYKTDNPTTVLINNIKIEIEDKMPLVLCLGLRGKLMYGINLNMCPENIKTVLLNEIWNLDPKYYSETIPKLAPKGLAPLSSPVIGTFSSIESQEKFADYLSAKYGLDKSQLTFRTYDISKIKDLRFVEVWAWKYIPHLTYTGTIKAQEMKLIQEHLKKRK